MTISWRCFGQLNSWIRNKCRRQNEDPMMNLSAVTSRTPNNPVPEVNLIQANESVVLQSTAKDPKTVTKPVVPQPTDKDKGQKLSSLKRSTSVNSYPRLTRCQSPYLSSTGKPRLPPKVPIGNLTIFLRFDIPVIYFF